MTSVPMNPLDSANPIDAAKYATNGAAAGINRHPALTLRAPQTAEPDRPVHKSIIAKVPRTSCGHGGPGDSS